MQYVVPPVPPSRFSAATGRDREVSRAVGEAVHSVSVCGEEGHSLTVGLPLWRYINRYTAWEKWQEVLHTERPTDREQC